MSASDMLILERVKWDWFVSCTVKKRNASDIYLMKKAFAILRWVARNNKLYFKSMPWALRIESGFDPEHRHFHALVGGIVNKSLPDRMKCIAKWDKLCGLLSNPEIPRGTCRVRLYASQGGAAAYLAKVLNSAEYEGWTRATVRISDAAQTLARYGAFNCATGTTGTRSVL